MMLPYFIIGCFCLLGINADEKKEPLSVRIAIRSRHESVVPLVRGKANERGGKGLKKALAQTSVTNSKMFPFGPLNGDTVMGTTDDGCEKMTLSVAITYFGTSYNEMWVCNNGIVTFDGTIYWYTPRAMSSSSQNKRIIATYWADIDTRFGVGVVYYGQHTSGSILTQGKQLVEDALQGIPNFQPTSVTVVTWYKCTFYGANPVGKTKQNTFQLVLVSDGPRTFGFNIYDQLVWTTGTASGGDATNGLGGTPAAIGFSNRYVTNQWYQVPGFSFSSNALQMTQVTNIQGPFVPPWQGCWLHQFNLIGTLAPIMDCLREQRCCVMQGNRYQPDPIPGCTQFYQWDYLNSVPWAIPQSCSEPGTIFDVFPTICTCNHVVSVNPNTCSSTI